ncbi:MAG: serine hydrolase, partial [Candidatus Kaiserbacteria bacterium]|nr:serine hydrolase [Candidatus Kaiserbacteria bacterium]
SAPVLAAEPSHLIVHAPASLPVTAKAYGVFDVESGELLLAHNEEAELPVASVTKLFTAAAALRAADTPLTITAADVATEGRAGKLHAGDEYSVHELLFPLLLESSNDAATALERVVGPVVVAGREFGDAAGLSSRNIASVHSLVTEVRSLYLTEPHIFDITKLSQKVGEYTGWINNSPVRDLPGYQGGKHGYTEAAGRTLTAIFKEDSLGGHELGYIILGSTDIKRDLIALRQVVEDSVELQ